MVNAYENETQALAALTGQALPAWNAELPRLDRIDRWWRWNPKPIRLKKATAEHRMLRDMGHTPWLRLVVTTLAQTLYLWRAWTCPATTTTTPAHANSGNHGTARA